MMASKRAVNPFDMDALRLTPEEVTELVARQKTTETPPSTKRKPATRQRTGFTIMTHEAARAGYLALGCPQALVWHYLLYLAWKDKSRTVDVPNTTLKSWGVGRWGKYRALRKLEQAGLICVERHRRRSPRVTLLKLLR
jgi:hypothetical protein